MRIVAIDSSSRAGSLALWADGEVVASRPGDPALSHSARLPGEIWRLLDEAGWRLDEVTHLALSIGPGSLTGLRVGVATAQGLSLARHWPVVGISSLDAMALAASSRIERQGSFVASIKNALRGEVFTALYGRTATPADEVTGLGLAEIEGPRVGALAGTLARWHAALGAGEIAAAVDAALDPADHAVVVSATTDIVLTDGIAAEVAALGAARAARGEAGPPHALRPLYVRRPDAVVARERRDAAGHSTGS